MKVEFKLKNGQVKSIPSAHAKILAKLGRGSYFTRDMVAEQAFPFTDDTRTIQETDSHIKPENLEAMSKEDLHALAKERGVKVHHMAGADKVRAALMEAQA